MMKRVDIAVYNAFKDAQGRHLEGRRQNLGLAEDGVDYALDENNKRADHPGDGGQGRTRPRPTSSPARSRSTTTYRRSSRSRPGARDDADRAATAGGGTAPPPAIELRGIDKRFGAVHANRDIDLAVARGHDPRHRRRERRRQVDADEHPLRLLPGRRRRDPASTASRSRDPPRPGRDRAPASAWCTSTSCWSSRSPCSRTSCSAPRAARCSRPALARARARARSGSSATTASRSTRRAWSTICRSGVQQRVEILKALYRGADILILDEPTGVLTPQEADHLFRILRNLQGAGQDRHPDHPQAARDHGGHRQRQRDAPGRDGGAPSRPPTTSREELAELMVGRRVLLRVEKAPRRGRREPVLEVARPRGRATTRACRGVKGVSFDVRAGEIVGIAGVAGNGQSELLEALAGIRRPSGGAHHARAASSIARPGRSAARARARPTCPRTGCAWAWCTAFAGLGERHPRLPGRARATAAAASCDRGRDRRSLRATGSSATTSARATPLLEATSFSGGNQQKIVLAREMERDPDLLLVGQPTRGVDIGAIEFIHRRLVAHARRRQGDARWSRSSSTRSSRSPTASW